MVEEHNISTWKIVLAALLLAVSSFIYLIFRPSDIIAFRFIDRAGLSGTVELLRSFTSGINLPAMVIYSIPDGLWLVSYMLIADSLLPASPAKPLWIIALSGNAVASELAQYWHLLPGVFDFRDLMCYLLPTLAYLIFKRNTVNYSNYLDSRNYLAVFLIGIYLLIAGASVSRLNIPFILTCGCFIIILTVISSHYCKGYLRRTATVRS